MNEIKSNTLITYEGGGYDGCIWEWNFCLFDNQGEFHNIYSSGCNGCETRDEITEFMNDEHNIEHGNFNVYHLNNNEFGFTNTLMGGIVVELVNKLNEFWNDSLLDTEVTYECDECKNDVSDEGISCEPVGCGGIVIMDDTKLCIECYHINTCCYCGEYQGGESDKLNMNGYCPNCYDEDYDMDEVVCNEQDDYDELEVDEKYKVFEYHRNENNILTDVTIVKGTWNDELEKYPVELFNISYGVINPNQQSLFS